MREERRRRVRLRAPVICAWCGRRGMWHGRCVRGAGGGVGAAVLLDLATRQAGGLLTRPHTVHGL